MHLIFTWLAGRKDNTTKYVSVAGFWAAIAAIIVVLTVIIGLLCRMCLTKSKNWNVTLLQLYYYYNNEIQTWIQLHNIHLKLHLHLS